MQAFLTLPFLNCKFVTVIFILLCLKVMRLLFLCVCLRPASVANWRLQYFVSLFHLDISPLASSCLHRPSTIVCCFTHLFLLPHICYLLGTPSCHTMVKHNTRSRSPALFGYCRVEARYDFEPEHQLGPICPRAIWPVLKYEKRKEKMNHGKLMSRRFE